MTAYPRAAWQHNLTPHDSIPSRLMTAYPQAAWQYTLTPHDSIPSPSREVRACQGSRHESTTFLSSKIYRIECGNCRSFIVVFLLGSGWLGRKVNKRSKKGKGRKGFSLSLSLPSFSPQNGNSELGPKSPKPRDAGGRIALLFEAGKAPCCFWTTNFSIYFTPFYFVSFHFFLFSYFYP